MIFISLSAWKIREFATKNPKLYEECRVINPEIKPIEEANKSYNGIEGWVNDFESIPDGLFEHLEFKRVKPLWQTDFKGDVKATDLKQALLHHHVHLPGNELLTINEVFVLNDACTERVQEEIQNGFRIIAICPQHGQRRPDYVMGRGFGTKQVLPTTASEDVPF
jgi:hypothetical protein